PPLPAGAAFGSAVPSQGACSNNAGTVICNLGTLAGAAGASITLVVTPGAAGVITNRATVSRGEADANAANNAAAVTAAVILPSLTITDATVTEPAVGTTQAVFNVLLNPAASNTVTVQ